MAAGSTPAAFANLASMGLMQPQPSTPKPGGSNRFTTGCLMLFAVPFIAGGTLALVQGIRQHGTNPDANVAIIVGGVFTLVGLLLVLGVWYGAAASAKSDARKAQNPDKPWMWRDDWANGVINDSTKGGAIGLWIFTVLWNAISIPVALLVIPQELPKGNHLALLVLLFPLVGVFLLIAAIYRTLQAARFGTSKCHLERVPIVPGRTFGGDIELNTQAAPENGFRLRIASIRVVTTRTGKNRSTTEHLLWDEEIVVEAGAAMRSPMGTRIPFVFVTPPDAQPTDESDSYDRYIWRLSTKAEFSGVDYSAEFQIPLFDTGEKADGSEFAAFQQRHRAEAVRHPVGVSSGVRITALPGGGEEFRIDGRKTIGSTLMSLLFLAAWNAGIVAMIRFEVPWGFPAVFIAFDLLFIVATIDYFLGRWTVSVDASGVRVRKEWLGLGSGSTKSYDAATIGSIDGTAVGQSSTSFGITMKLNDGGTRQLGSYLPDRETADAVAAKMMAGLRRA
jgi:hypothetical protein